MMGFCWNLVLECCEFGEPVVNSARLVFICLDNWLQTSTVSAMRRKGYSRTPNNARMKEDICHNQTGYR